MDLSICEKCRHRIKTKANGEGWGQFQEYRIGDVVSDGKSSFIVTVDMSILKRGAPEYCPFALEHFISGKPDTVECSDSGFVEFWS